ncbi:MAG: hypothetical protein ACRDJE_15440 [Dehalococcoidia bacterium]
MSFLIAATALSACLGGLPHDSATHTVVTAPGEVLDITDLPLHDDRDHWLMRDLPRWCGAAEARWGGNPDDRAVLTARAVRFRDEVAAMRALDKLTPEYLALTFRDRISGGPWPVDYPAALPGDEAKANEYDVRLPPDVAAQLQLTGQQIAVRTGRALILTESIGLSPDELVPAIDAMVRAAEGGQGGC